jgi:hypothetical protein
MARRGMRYSPLVASLAYGRLGGTDVTGAMGYRRVGDYQGRDPHWYRGLDLDHAGAVSASVGPAAGRGDGPVRPGDLRSRKVAGQRHPSVKGTPWWRSKWWHIAVLGLCAAIFIVSLFILGTG